MLVDEIDITIKAGDGGEGKVSFGKMEKSGPDGGNGGKGGGVYIVGNSDLTLLNFFSSKNKVEAQRGGNGDKNKMTGRDGDDLKLLLPIGSLVTDRSSGKVFELDKVGQNILLCTGGIGGIGNYELRSSTNVTPKNTIPPTRGQKRNISISLRFIADYGLIGLPSAGKSSLLNELTNTNVKTAAYDFTTLSANLGVLPNKKIIADIPGLIEGASKGKGLGVKFLKHIQKVGLLLHCLSSDSQDPLSDYKTIRTELGKFANTLLKKKEIILLTKHDLLSEKELKVAKKKLKKLNLEIILTSIHDEKSLHNLLLKLN